MNFQQTNQKNNIWLQNLSGNWRDVQCPCGSSFHFEGEIDSLFAWEKIHLQHMTTDTENHEIISFYPDDMIIYYHSQTGYVMERRKHKKYELDDVKDACLRRKTKLTGV
ncbi:MAG: hypothetical protein ACPKPY_03360 [Nitrososphaeraceae archaeon]